jgi:hypothetical protein
MLPFLVVVRTCCLICKILLLATLVNWVAAGPLVWIVRDGLGPDTIESTGMKAAFKFLVEWGVPALIITVPLYGLTWVERRCHSAQQRAELMNELRGNATRPASS